MCFRPGSVQTPIRCPECTTFNPPANKVCKKCGAVMPEATIPCPHCKVQQPVSNKVCKNCGFNGKPGSGDPLKKK